MEQTVALATPENELKRRSSPVLNQLLQRTPTYKGSFNNQDFKSMFKDVIKIGQGQYGYVYRGTSIETGEKFALKKIKFDSL